MFSPLLSGRRIFETSSTVLPCKSTSLRPVRPTGLLPKAFFSSRPYQCTLPSFPRRVQPFIHTGGGTVHLGIRSHTVHFSHSCTRRLRNTYFPKSSPSPRGKSQRRGGIFLKFRTIVNSLPSGVVLWTILGLNGAVYFLWNIALDRANNHRDLSVLASLFNNFTLSWRNWTEGRFWTILTSCFSNQATSHILFNAFTFYFMAPPVIQLLGNTSFLTLYLGSGIASNLVTLYFNEYWLRQPRIVHGASGAIYAVISFMASTAPKATFLFFGLIPVPAWGCVAGLFTWDLYNAIYQRQTGVSEISHLSGLLSGIVYFLHKAGRLPRFF